MEKSELWLEKMNNYLKSKLYQKYLITKNKNNIFLIDRIVFNEKCHLVTAFKEFLIYEDDFEFLNKFYHLKASFTKLKKYVEYYTKYSIIFPNYSILSESKYIYKTIHNKQKMIKKWQHKEEKTIKNKTVIAKKEENNKSDDEDNNKFIFNSKIYNSILKSSENECISIFDISKNENKDKDNNDNISISLINDIIRNIDNNEKENKAIKNFKLNYEYNIKPINIIKKLKNIKKGNTSNTTNNNTNNSLNTNKSTLKNNNSIIENNKAIYQSSIINIKKTLKDNNFKKFKSNVLNNVTKLNNYPLSLASSKKNSILSFKKFNKLKNFISKKIDNKNINSNSKIINNNDSSIIFNNKKNEKLKKIRNNVIKIDENKYKIVNKNYTDKINKINNKFYFNNKKIMIDFKKCLSERKIYINNFKSKILRNLNDYNHKKIKIQNLINNKNKRKGGFVIGETSKKILTKSLFTSNTPRKKFNTYSDLKRKIQQNTNKTVNGKIYNNHFNYNTSSSVINLKKSFNIMNFANSKNLNNTNKKTENNITLSIIKGINFFSSNSSLNKNDNNKKLINKITKRKTKLALNNNYLIMNIKNNFLKNSTNTSHKIVLK